MFPGGRRQCAAAHCRHHFYEFWRHCFCRIRHSERGSRPVARVGAARARHCKLRICRRRWSDRAHCEHGDKEHCDRGRVDCLDRRSDCQLLVCRLGGQCCARADRGQVHEYRRGRVAVPPAPRGLFWRRGRRRADKGLSGGSFQCVRVRGQSRIARRRGAHHQLGRHAV